MVVAAVVYWIIVSLTTNLECLPQLIIISFVWLTLPPALQPRPEPITPIDFNTIFDEQYGNNQDTIPDQHQHNSDDIIPVPGGAHNEMT